MCPEKLSRTQLVQKIKALEEKIQELNLKESSHHTAGDSFLDIRNQLMALLENSDDFILMSDDKGVPRFFNSAYADAIKKFLNVEMKPGIKPHEFLEDPEAVAYWDGLHKRVLSGEKFNAQFSHELNPGDVRHFDHAFCPITIKGEIKGFTEITRDITGLRQKEDQLKKNKDMYQAVSNLTSDYAYGFRVNPDGSIVNEWVTGALQKITGFSKEELTEKGGWESLVYPADIHIPTGQLKTLMSGQPKTVVYRILDKDKEIKWVMDHARPEVDEKTKKVTFIYGAAKDITDQKLIEEELFEKATIVDQADESIILTDCNGDISYVNPAFEKISGFKMNELIGYNFKILKSEKHDDDFYLKMWKRISQGETWTGNIINKMKDGRFCEFETSISPIKNKEGDVIKFVSINRDVTQEKALESRLLQAQKMEAIGTLAGGIAHDFNNLLSGIIGYTEIALMDSSEDSDVADNLKKSLNACDRAKELVKQILTFSRQNEIAHRPIKVGPIVKDVISLIRPSVPSFIKIKSKVSSQSTVLADASQIHQVLMNLSTNACYAMRKEGGTLEFSIRDDIVENSNLSIRNDVKPGKYQKIVVADTGHGLSEEIKDRIFEPFFTTKKMGKGTGLGLSVAHGIIQNHNGFISVESTPGKGTKFDILLPVIDSEENIQIESDISLPEGDETILFVDDETFQGDVVKQLLERLGYTVTVQSNSMSALSVFKKNPEQFDLIITDMTMPHMTGDQLSKEILSIRPDIPIILCTGFSEKIDAQKALELGVSKYIEKPINKIDFAITVREAIDQPT